MEDQKLALEELPNGARQEMKDGADLIRNASYQKSETGTYSLCVDNEPLVERFPEVLALFPDEPGTSETRITAIHLEKRAKLPVKKGATVVLIPLNSTSETPTVNNEELVFGKYARLTAGAPMELAIEGAFYCLLLLRQPLDA